VVKVVVVAWTNVVMAPLTNTTPRTV